MDLYISDWYKPNDLNILNLWYTLVYNLVDFQSFLVDMNKKLDHQQLGIEHLVHKVMVDMDQKVVIVMADQWLECNERTDLLCIVMDNYISGCDSQLDIWHLFHMFQDMDLSIFDYYMLHFVDNQHLLYTLVYKLVDFQYNQEHMNIQLDYWFHDIESLDRKEMDCRDLLQLVLMK